MVIVLIRTALRPDADLAAYERDDARMNALVATMPGFLDAKSYAASDGDTVSMIRFTSTEALRAWRDDPEHAAVQRAGRERYFASYEVTVCEVTRAYRFPDG